MLWTSNLFQVPSVCRITEMTAEDFRPWLEGDSSYFSRTAWPRRIFKRTWCAGPADAQPDQLWFSDSTNEENEPPLWGMSFGTRISFECAPLQGIQNRFKLWCGTLEHGCPDHKHFLGTGELPVPCCVPEIAVQLAHSSQIPDCK